MNSKMFDYHMIALNKMSERYDESVNMIWEDLDNPNSYHTQIKKGRVHSVRTSAEYALALLDGGGDVKRANNILRQVISLQDHRRDKSTFGLWPYFLEEGIDQMNPPDFKSTREQCIPMLQVIRDYPQKIEADLLPYLKEACLDGCRCMLRQPSNFDTSNVKAGELYALMLAGELLEDSILQQAQDNFDKWYYRTMYNGCYDEYNSPEYSMILVKILGLMLQHITSRKCHSKIVELNDFAWKMIAEHYHAITAQWSGPKLRTNSDWMNDKMLSFFEMALDFKLNLTDNKEFEILDMRYGVKCPEKYKSYFLKCREHEIRRMLHQGYNYPYYGHSRVEMSYTCKNYTVATFHRSEGWNEHRYFLTYLGNKQNKYCMRCRVLHDFTDYSSAYWTCVQSKNAILAGIQFSTNRGDRHWNLDIIKDATITASDLRIRMQIEGDLSFVHTRKTDNKLFCDVDGIPVEVHYAYSIFDEEDVRVELNCEGNFLYFDLVLYHGEKRKINFNKIMRAVNILTFLIGDTESHVPTTVSANDHVISMWNVGGHTLKLSCMEKPSEFIPMIMDSKQFLDDVWIEKKAAEEPLG